MATITKDQNNAIIVTPDNCARPAIFSDWKSASVSYSANSVTLNIDGKGFKFGAWPYTPCGTITSINGAAIAGLTTAQVATIIEKAVLTDDAFSGNPTYATSGTAYTGTFTAIHAVTDTVIDTTNSSNPKNTGGTNPITNLTGVTIKAGDTIYGTWTQVQLTSGTAVLYSPL